MEIKHVKLHTNQINLLKEFYVHQLGFRLIEENSSEIVIQVGKSKLSFENKNTTNNPYYHFAFTIAGNQFESAKKLIQSKVELATEDDHDEVFFEFLNAKSFYFHDPVGNIVEFIARNSYSNDTDDFTIDKVECISEIGLTVHNVLTEGEKLINHGLLPFDGDPLNEKGLNFLGDKDAYLILGPVGRKWFFSHQIANVFPLTVELEKGLIVELSSEGEIIISRE